MCFSKSMSLFKGMGLLAASVFAVSNAFSAIIFESNSEGYGEVTVEGTSTLHDWEVKGHDIRGSFIVEMTSFELENLAHAGIQAEVRIPVRSLTSDNRGMDRRMFNAMEASDYEEVTFVLSSLVLIESDDLGALSKKVTESSLAVMATGDLTIVGTSQEVEVPALIHWDGNQLRIETEAVIVMSEYGIDPPRALMGTIRTGDEVTVRAIWTPALK